MEDFCTKCPNRVECLVVIGNRKLCKALHENFFALVTEFIRRHNSVLAIVDLQILNYEGPESLGFELISRVGMEFLELRSGDWYVEERTATISKHQENREVENNITSW